MNTTRGGCLALSVVLACAGCAASRIGWQQREFHSQLGETYDAQMVTNLARARLGLPFVHLKYGETTGEARDQARGEFRYNEGGQDATVVVGTDVVTTTASV